MNHLRKIGVIIANELYGIVVDRNALLIMIAAPLALASIIGLAFGGFARGEVGFDPIPVLVVNQDQPVESNGEVFAFGSIFVEALVPPVHANSETIAANDLWQIVDATLVTDTVAARAQVEAGDAVAALVIPADFSARIAFGGAASFPDTLSEQTSDAPIAATLYTDPASSDRAQIVEGIVAAIGNRIVAGSAATTAAIEAIYRYAAVADPALAQQLTERLQAGDLPFEKTLSAEGVDIPLERETESGAALTFNPFATFGISQAIFFMLFTAMATSAEFLRDKRNGILRRLMATPTPIATLVLGKIGAAAVTCAAQVLVLMGALTLINALAAGQFEMIFGTNIAALLLVVVAVALAAAGLAMAVASFTRTPEQATAINSIIAIGMGMIGGAFFNVQAAGPLATASRFTINYWAVDAVTRLSQGNAAIGLNLVVLGTIAAVALVVAFTRFSRTLEA